MKRQKPKPTQLELFAGHVSSGAVAVHSLGLLGWRDPVWTTRFEIELLSGETFWLNLETIRRLHCAARQLSPSEVSALGEAAAEKPAQS
jgi:hypothetical protein